MEKKKVEETLFPELVPSVTWLVMFANQIIGSISVQSNHIEKLTEMIEGIIAPNVNGK